MPAKIVLGAQWGDEGKAKVVDYMTLSADIVARYQGGANAGHTVQVGDSTFVFHIIPSGIIHSDKICVIGNGVVADPVALIAELDELESRGILVADRLFISGNAHVVMPYHKALEKAEEEDPSWADAGYHPARHWSLLPRQDRALQRCPHDRSHAPPQTAR